MKKHIVQRLCSAVLVLVLTAGMVIPVHAVETTVELSETTLSLTVGATHTLTGAVKVDGVQDDAATGQLIYASDNAAVAAVDAATGVVTAVKAGSANITATYTAGGDSLTATCAVTVTAASVPATRVTLSKVGEEFLEPKNTMTLTAVMIPANSTDTLLWHSSDPAIAKVRNGEITGISPGETIITAKAGNAVSDELKVAVSGLILPESMELVVGKSEELTLGRFGRATQQIVNWSSSNNMVAGVRDGVVSGYSEGVAVITVVAGSYRAGCTVTVKKDVAGDIVRQMDTGEVLEFSTLLTDLNARAQSATGGALEYITGLQVDTTRGILYHGYTSPELPGRGVGSTDVYYPVSVTGSQLLSRVSFVPKPDFGGTAVISYTGCGAGKEFTGIIRVEVDNSGDVTYHTSGERLVSFAVEDFSAVCAIKSGRTLKYVTFTPPAESRGVLYYQYNNVGQYSQRVTPGTKYHVYGGTRQLEGVSFLPAKDVTGIVTIPYYATDSTDVTYAGTVTITVYASPSVSQESEGIVYQVARESRVSMELADFNSASLAAVSSALHYVYFTQPPATQGTLYYDGGTEVSEDIRYFSASTPLLSKVSFVPAEGYTGAVTIPYRGYSVSGKTFEGKVTVHVSDEDGVIAYSSPYGGRVYFNALDFNELSAAITDGGLNVVRFTLPPADQGTLYYYASSSSSGTKVTDGRGYSKSSLDKIAFVPASGFRGVVSIAFEGEGQDGQSFYGTVEIAVSGGTLSEEDPLNVSVVYTTGSIPVRLNPEDFRKICMDRLKKDLSYIRFKTLPDELHGKLLQNYEGIRTGTGVKTGTRIYMNSQPRIRDVVFVPRSGFQGMVPLNYEAVDTSGKSHEGTVQILVSNSYLTRQFQDLTGYSWAAPSIEFLHYAGVVQGYSDRNYGPGGNITRGAALMLVCRFFDFAPRSATGFRDVPAGSVYEQAALTAKALGIVDDTDGYLRPYETVSRQEVAVMLVRGMVAAGWTNVSASTLLLDMFYDGDSVANYARTSMAVLVKMGIIQGNEQRLNPHGKITRAQMAAMLHRIWTQ